MNKQKIFYDAPTAEVLVVRFEGGIMVVSNGINYATVAGGAGGDDEYEDVSESY